MRPIVKTLSTRVVVIVHGTEYEYAAGALYTVWEMTGNWWHDELSWLSGRQRSNGVRIVFVLVGRWRLTSELNRTDGLLHSIH